MKDQKFSFISFSWAKKHEKNYKLGRNQCHFYEEKSKQRVPEMRENESKG